MEQFDQIIERLNQIEKQNGIWSVVSTIVIVIAFYLLWKYLTKSIETKAVYSYNQSLELLKADLQEKIGTKLSNQKAEFSKELAEYNKELEKDLTKLTSELAISNSKKIEFQNEERKSIVEYLNSYSEYIYGALDVKLFDYKYNNHEEINSKLLEINKAYSKTNIAWNKMKFWTINSELISITHVLNTKILELTHSTQSTLGILRYNLTWGKIYTDSYLRKMNGQETHSEYSKFLEDEDKNIRAENDIIIKKYLESKIQVWTEIMEINHKFQELSKNYLNKIDQVRA